RNLQWTVRILRSRGRRPLPAGRAQHHLTPDHEEYEEPITPQMTSASASELTSAGTCRGRYELCTRRSPPMPFIHHSVADAARPGSSHDRSDCSELARRCRVRVIADISMEAPTVTPWTSVVTEIGSGRFTRLAHPRML